MNMKPFNVVLAAALCATGFAANAASVIDTSGYCVSSGLRAAKIPRDISSLSVNASTRNRIVIGKYVIFRIARPGRNANILVVVA